MKENCENCNYAYYTAVPVAFADVSAVIEFLDASNMYWLECRKNPPKMFVDRGIIKAAYPPVQVDWWCGKYRRKCE